MEILNQKRIRGSCLGCGSAALFLILPLASCAFIFPVDVPENVAVGGSAAKTSVATSAEPPENRTGDDPVNANRSNESDGIEGCECGGFAGIPCDEGQFCSLPMGSCDSADLCGTCTRPGACPEINDPVCGCDGRTYANECFAAMAEMNIAHRGECDA